MSRGPLLNKQQSLITPIKEIFISFPRENLQRPFIQFRLMLEEVFAAVGDFIPVSNRIILQCFMTLLFFADFLQ
jgi:hypothetical protein